LLYADNTIFINSVRLSPRLSRFLIPQRIASIRSLEFCWTIPIWGPPGEPRLNDRLYTNLMSGVNSSAFPNLQRLHVCIESYMVEPYGPAPGLRDDSHPRIASVMPDPADRIATEFGPQLKKFFVTVPMMVYNVLASSLGTRSEVVLQDGSDTVLRMWRRMELGEEQMSGANEGIDQRGMGYWIRGYSYSYYAVPEMHPLGTGIFAKLPDIVSAPSSCRIRGDDETV
jgi:hypothetical protein